MKRINPQTGKEFVRGDTRDKDDRVFIGYKVSKPLKKDGYFGEDWCTVESWQKKIKVSKEYRKNNPEYFANYEIENREHRNQLKYEWMQRNPEKTKEMNKHIHRKKRAKARVKGTERLDPLTGKQFIRGRREGDLYFDKYIKHSFLEGTNFYSENWIDLETFLKRKFRDKIANIRNEKREPRLQFSKECDLTPEFLWDIYPHDNPVCPILGIPFELERNTQGFAELDRIDNKKGYIKSNVHWISHRANMIKLDASVDELFTVANYLKDKLKD